MDAVFAFFLELIVDGMIEMSGDRKMSRWIRYPLIVFSVLFFGTVIGMIFFLAIGMSHNEPLAAAVISLLGIFMLLGTFLKFRKLYFERQSDDWGNSGR